ncbi:hypothetical protein [uncultured Flavobacterium sp.]
MKSKKNEMRKKMNPDHDDHVANCRLPSEKVCNLSIKELSPDST